MIFTWFVPDLSRGADTSPLFSPPEKNRIQATVSSLLFYARGVDPTILPAVNTVASLQANPTQYVAAAALRLLQYCARYSNNSITFHPCVSSQMPPICQEITQDQSPVQYFTSVIKITLRLLMVPFWHSALFTYRCHLCGRRVCGVVPCRARSSLFWQYPKWPRLFPVPNQSYHR